MNNESPMVFKSSKVAAQLAVEMHNDSHSQNTNMPVNSMKEQVAYLDGMHSKSSWVCDTHSLGIQSCHFRCYVNCHYGV